MCRHAFPTLRSQRSHHRNDANTTRSTTKSDPHPPEPPRPSGVTIVGPTTAIDTHKLAGNIVPKRVAPPLTPAVYQGPDIATVWTCPTLYITYTEGDAQTTHRARAIGEARGHRSALAQNSLLMYPPSFSFLWTCRRFGVSSPHGGLVPMCLRCCGCTLLGFARWRYFVDMWVAEGHTARWPWLCVLFVHRLAVWV